MALTRGNAYTGPFPYPSVVPWKQYRNGYTNGYTKGGDVARRKKFDLEYGEGSFFFDESGKGLHARLDDLEGA